MIALGPAFVGIIFEMMVCAEIRSLQATRAYRQSLLKNDGSNDQSRTRDKDTGLLSPSPGGWKIPWSKLLMQGLPLLRMNANPRTHSSEALGQSEQLRGTISHGSHPKIFGNDARQAGGHPGSSAPGDLRKRRKNAKKQQRVIGNNQKAGPTQVIAENCLPPPGLHQDHSGPAEDSEAGRPRKADGDTAETRAGTTGKSRGCMRFHEGMSEAWTSSAKPSVELIPRGHGS